MNDTTFSKAVVIDTDTNDTEIEIIHGGVGVGLIRSYHSSIGTPVGSSITASYHVEFYTDEDWEAVAEERRFAVSGHPRTALAAAKAYARETLNS